MKALPPVVLASPAPRAIIGSVLEIREMESCNYLHLKTGDGETRAAIPKAPAKKGSQFKIETVTIIKDFESRSLKQTFNTLAFRHLLSTGPGKPTHAAPMAHLAPARREKTPDVRVAKAGGATAWTVEQMNIKATELLKDKSAQVPGKVIKYNPAIMRRIRPHLRDGSGITAEGSNDIVVMAPADLKLVPIVTVKSSVLK